MGLPPASGPALPARALERGQPGHGFPTLQGVPLGFSFPRLQDGAYERSHAARLPVGASSSTVDCPAILAALSAAASNEEVAGPRPMQHQDDGRGDWKKKLFPFPSADTHPPCWLTRRRQRMGGVISERLRAPGTQMCFQQSDPTASTPIAHAQAILPCLFVAVRRQQTSNSRTLLLLRVALTSSAPITIPGCHVHTGTPSSPVRVPDPANPRRRKRTNE
ncbi:hypothetical protein ACCO45_003943 [Purpureocillium lilacinum]|uniref:Uncharacterized protein n=1 Tax=Purpureocillium lilacinum TaxID=33203 RepID=A0ACC4E447_PURLI